MRAMKPRNAIFSSHRWKPASLRAGVVFACTFSAACADVWGFHDLAGSSDGGRSDSGSGVTEDAGHDAARPGDAEASPDAPTCTCINDLSNIGLADFYIAFTLTTTSTVPMSILNQRSTCDTAHPFWDVFTGTNGAYSPSEGVVYINVGDGSSTFDDVSTQRVVNDGQPHRIVIARTGGTTFTLTVDGEGGAQTGGPTDPLNGTLPTLQVGADVCSSYEPIAGQMTDVCMTVDCPLH